MHDPYFHQQWISDTLVPSLSSQPQHSSLEDLNDAPQTSPFKTSSVSPDVDWHSFPPDIDTSVNLSLDVVDVAEVQT